MSLRLAALLLLLGACNSVVPLSAFDEALRDSYIRTVAIEEHYSLYSPYDLAVSRSVSEVVGENLDAVSTTLGVWLDVPIHVHAYPVEQLDVEGSPVGSQAVHGFSNTVEDGSPPTIGFIVSLEGVRNAPEGTDLTPVFRFNYGGILRHELGHLISSAYLHDGPTWFQEALALELEYSSVVDGRLVPQETPQTLFLARRELADFTLADVLDWQEDIEGVASGNTAIFKEGRPLAHSYMRFLLERQGGDRSIEAFRRIFEMDRAEHLALEDAWRAWLAE